MLTRLYDWTLSLARKKSAEAWLFIIAFVESSVFLVPAEVLFVPMAIAEPKRVWRQALLASLGSILGGMAGWLLGHFAYEAIALPVLEFYGKADEFEAMKASVDMWWVAIFLVTSGVSHLPPLKVVTILSGVIGVDFLLFTLLAVIARGGKFFLLAWLLHHYGAPIRDFIEKRLRLIAIAVTILLVALVLAVQMFAA